MGKLCHMAISRSSFGKYTKINKYWFLNIDLVLTHTISELGVLGIARKLSVPSVTAYKKIQKKIKIYFSRAVQSSIDHNMVDWNFRG